MTKYLINNKFGFYILCNLLYNIYLSILKEVLNLNNFNYIFIKKIIKNIKFIVLCYLGYNNSSKKMT